MYTPYTTSLQRKIKIFTKLLAVIIMISYIIQLCIFLFVMFTLLFIIYYDFNLYKIFYVCYKYANELDRI